MPGAIHTIAICGAGTMGAGIAEVAATAGFPTILFDSNQAALEKARATIAKNVFSQQQKNKISSSEAAQTIERISFTAEINECKADLVIEAIIENLEAKKSLFRQLELLNKRDTIFATNTSSLSVSSIASTVTHPGRVAGMHFFNPPSLMKLVEVVKAKETTVAVIDVLLEQVKRFGKSAVLCKDVPGFIVNRVARPYYLEALKLLEEGYDVETIDKVLESTGFKMGPFRLMDLIGNDINFAVTVSLYEALGQPVRFRPSRIQQEKITTGALGRKTGKGYYEY